MKTFSREQLRIAILAGQANFEDADAMVANEISAN
jgi:hypothetical protein